MKQPESQGRSTRKRSDHRLNPTVEKNLMAYVAVASAAGVGMLTTTPAAEAKVVYTPANEAVSSGISLDLNQDGIVDYRLSLGIAVSIAGSYRISFVQVCHDLPNNFDNGCSSSTNAPNAKNVVREAASGAMALPFGAPIGPGQSFKGVGVPVLMGERLYYSGSNTQEKWKGPWVNGGGGVTNRYLGLKFQIAGKWHFGWARLTFVTTPHKHISATLTGYAYETVPNTRIRAGQTTGTAETSSIAPFAPVKAGDGTSLGSLALGAPGLSIWRRQEDSPN